MKERVKAFEQTGLIEIAPFYILKEEDGYCINMQVKHITDGGPIVSLDDIEVIANQLLEFVEEVRNKDKFFNGENFYYVKESGYIESGKFYLGHAYVQACAFLGNVFKTEAEAEAHKDEILAKFEEARKKYARS